MSILNYTKDEGLAFCPGVFPVLELLATRPHVVREIWLHKDAGQVSASGACDGENLPSPGTLRNAGNENNQSHVRNAGVEKILTHAAALGIPVHERSAWVERLAKKQNCHAVAVLERYAAMPATGRHILLHRCADSGNLGAIMRTATAFGYGTLALVGGGADAFGPATLRASMGAAFRLELPVFLDFDAYRAAFPAQTVFPFTLEGRIRPELAAKDFFAKTPPDDCLTLAFGNEGAGLPPEAASWGTPIRIPQTPGVDSLNLSVAVGIGAYAFAPALEG